MTNQAINLINQAKDKAAKNKIRRFFADKFFNNNNKRKNKFVTRIVVLTLILLLSLVVFKLIQKSRQDKFTTLLHQSIINQQINENEKAKENLKEIIDSKLAPRHIKSIASLRYAAFLLEDNKRADAIKLYLEINNCKFCDDYIKDFAGLLAIKLWALDEQDSANPDLISKIEKIEKNSKILKGHILEQKAFLEMKRGNNEQAYKIFDTISKDKNISENVKKRASDGIRIINSSDPNLENKKEEKDSKIKNENK